jgi:uncharacterized protein YjbJ (UPF0337 family)
MSKSPDTEVKPGDKTEVINSSPDSAAAKARDAARKQEVLKMRGEQVVEDAKAFAVATAEKGKRAVGSGVSRAWDSIKSGLARGWSGLGKAAGKTWDAALIGIGMGAAGKDYAVNTATAAKDAAIKNAAKAKAAAFKGAEAVSGAAVATKDHLMNDISGRSEVIQGARAAKEYASEKVDQAKGLVTEGRQFASEMYDDAKEYAKDRMDAATGYAKETYANAKDSVLRTGKAIIESKAAQYTAKGVKYAGIGAGYTIGVPLAMGAYAVAGPLLAWKNPQQLDEIRGQIREQFPTMGMNVTEALGKAGSWAAEKTQELGKKVWGRMTSAWDKLMDYKNAAKTKAMESMGVASTEQVKTALDEINRLRALIAEMQAAGAKAPEAQPRPAAETVVGFADAN